MRSTWTRIGLALLLAGRLAAPGLAADEPLGKRVKDRDPDIRSAAVKEVRAAPTLRGVRLVFPLLADDDAYVRDLTWAVLGAVENPEWIRWMGGATRTDRRPRIRRQVADFIGRKQVDAALPTLRELLADRDAKVRAAAATALGRYRGSSDAAGIVDGGLRDAEPTVRAAALEAHSRIDAPGAVAALMAAVKDPDQGVRCAALRSLRYGNRALAIEAGAWAMLEGGWRLRSQAIENARWLRDRRVVEGLIQGLRRVDRARIRADLFAALADLTGLEIPAQIEDWESWWKQNAVPWRKGGKIPRRDPVAHASGAARYYGIPVRSDRVVFLLDGSGSMREQISRDDSRVKMDTARAELLRVLDELGERIRFNVIVFHDAPDPFRPSLVSADARNRRKVETFVRKTTGKGRTNVFDALALALEDEVADTIFILSDGAPSVGSFLFRSRILDHVRRINRRRKIAIHTIAFGGRNVNRKFLEDLAAQNAGVSVVTTRK